jgi:hypothetical protein
MVRTRPVAFMRAGRPQPRRRLQNCYAPFFRTILRRSSRHPQPPYGSLGGSQHQPEGLDRHNSEIKRSLESHSHLSTLSRGIPVSCPHEAEHRRMREPTRSIGFFGGVIGAPPAFHATPALELWRVRNRAGSSTPAEAGDPQPEHPLTRFAAHATVASRSDDGPGTWETTLERSC